MSLPGGLQSALVDRARVVERQATGQRVDGRTVRRLEPGPWFECRIALAGPDAEAIAADRTRVSQQQTVLYKTVDTAGAPVALDNGSTIEVASNQPTASGTWRLSSQPLVIRKKLELLGAAYANVERVLEA